MKATVVSSLLVGIVALCGSQSSQAAGLRLSIGGIAGLTGARENSSDSVQAKGLSSERHFSLGAGALLESALTDSVGIEIGALYIARKFEIGNEALKLTRTVPTVFFPLEARLWVGNMLSFAGGVFAAARVGNQHDEITSGNATLGSFSSGNRKNVEYGMTVAGTLNIATVNKTGIFLEGRYNRGFTNSARDGLFEERIDDLWLMAGARLDLGT